MTRRVGFFIAAFLVIVALTGWGGWRAMHPAAGGRAGGPSASPRPGGSLTGSVRAEPSTFNSYVTNRQTEETLTFLTQAKLVRINRVTDEVEPWLAESWQELSQLAAGSRQPAGQVGGDGRQATAGSTFRVKLRQDVTFSDGTPFTSADVLFALEAIYDPPVNSPLAVRSLGQLLFNLGYNDVNVRGSAIPLRG